MAAASPLPLPGNAIHPLDAVAWTAWLQAHHDRGEGVWLVRWKTASGQPRMTDAEAVEAALCFGWIDSKPRTLDAQRSMLWFAPRQPGTGWSRLNKQRVERLIAQGRMQPAGLAKVRQAQADGSWTALDAVEDLVIPSDLADALAALPPAAACFDAFPRSVKRAILEWIQAARKPQTRAARVVQTAQQASRNERANQWRAPAGR